jgi:hypothetical protein
VSPILLHFPRRPLLLLAGLIAVLPLHADDTPAPSSGDHVVAIKSGDHTAYIHVRDTPNPYQNIPDSGPSTHPDQFSFNKTSPYANKSYATEAAVTSQDSSSYQKNLERSFVTKSYFSHPGDPADTTTPGLQSKADISSAAAYTHPASGYDKSFIAPGSSDTGQNKTAQFAATTSSFQGRAANIGGHPIKGFANTLANKTYAGPEVDAVKKDINRMNQGLISMKDLPDRPLTIDEVRALINHGAKPDYDNKNPAPGKALNDPDYQPDPAPAPLRDAPPPGHLKDDNDGVPDPGTMAHPQPPAPENSEPLPQ